MNEKDSTNEIRVIYSLDNPISNEDADEIMKKIGSAANDIFSDYINTNKPAKQSEITDYKQDPWALAIEIAGNHAGEMHSYRIAGEDDDDLVSDIGHTMENTAIIGSYHNPIGIFVPFAGDFVANATTAVKLIFGENVAANLPTSSNIGLSYKL